MWWFLSLLRIFWSNLVWYQGHCWSLFCWGKESYRFEELDWRKEWWWYDIPVGLSFIFHKIDYFILRIWGKMFLGILGFKRKRHCLNVRSSCAKVKILFVWVVFWFCIRVGIYLVSTRPLAYLRPWFSWSYFLWSKNVSCYIKFFWLKTEGILWYQC